ncbi:MAG: hypothetical protein LBH78_01870 [Rickettsiales bacterium]|jgi:hypothetical protein|nr:hypothetical protein [Rickettsiales bacterium]
MSQENLVTNDNNPSSIGTQTTHSSSEDSLKQEIQSLKKEVKSLKKQNQLNSGVIGLGVIGLIGYIIATNWSAIAPAFAGTATAAASPVIGIVIGAIIGAAVLVGASYAAWRYRAEIKAGFKYAAGKTVKGAKELYGKAKGAAVRAGHAVKEGAKNAADHLGDSLKEFAHSGEHPMESPLVQELLEQKEMKSEVNALTKVIKEDSSSIRIKTLPDKEQSRLKKILTKGTLDIKELQFVINIVSEHRDEIKNGIREYRFDQSVKRDNAKDAKERKNIRPSLFSSLGRKGSTQSEADVPLQKPFSSDLEVLDETATVEPARIRTKRSPLSSSLGSGSPKLKEVTSPRVPESLEDEWSQFVNDRMKKHALSTQTNGNEGDLAGLSTPESTRSNSLDAGMLTRIDSGSSTPSEYHTANTSCASMPTGNHFLQGVDSEELKRRLKGLDTSPNESVEQKRDSTSSGSPDSGKGSSGSSTPTGRQSLSMKDVKDGNPQAKLRRTNSPYKSEQPSTHMSEQKPTPVNQRLETLV